MPTRVTYNYEFSVGRCGRRFQRNVARYSRDIRLESMVVLVTGNQLCDRSIAAATLCLQTNPRGVGGAPAQDRGMAAQCRKNKKRARRSREALPRNHCKS